MRRRLDLAAALVAAPDVLFLDEPTTGLDPRSRAGLWETIRELVRTGSTLLLTTQYMEEADRLADNIVVIDHGRVIAEGTADQLKTQVGGERVEIIVEDHADITRAHRVLAVVAVGEVQTTTRPGVSPQRSTAAQTPCAEPCTSCTDPGSSSSTSDCAGPPSTMSS